MATVYEAVTPDFKETEIEYSIKGFPASNLIFFLGISFEPPLAGIIEIIFFMIIFFSNNQAYPLE